MRVVIKALVFSSLLPLLASYCFAQSLADSRPEVKICAILPVTGSISFYGVGFKDSALLALKNIESSKYRYKFIFEDNQSQTASSVAAFQELTAIEKCPVILSVTANVALTLAPLVRQKEIIHLGVSSDPIFADGKHNFNVWPSPDIPVAKLMEQFKIRNINKVALFGLEHAWPRAVFKILEQALNKEMKTVTMQEYFQPGETNMRPLLERFRRSGSDIGVLMSWSPELEIFGRQYHQLKIGIPLTSEYAFDSSQEISLFDSFWFVNLRSPDESFRESFKKAYNYYPYAQMELGNVMAKLVVDAYEKVGDGMTLPEIASISEELLSIKDKPSVIGPIGFGANGVLEAPYTVRVVKGDKAQDL